MTSASVMEPSAAPRFRRHVGTYTTGRPGPTVVLLGGVHGNEPAGVRAIETVLGALRERQPELRGSVVGLTGNIAALEKCARYVQHDLNRRWSGVEIDKLRRSSPKTDTAEQREQRELLVYLDPLMKNATEFLLLDLHSTSSPGVPFTVCGDTLRNRRLALFLPVPVLLGLEESIDGALAEYVTERGHAAIVVEGGLHTDPSTQLHHEAAVWLTLVASGALRASDVPDLAARARILKDGARGSPGVIEVGFRYALDADSQFLMRPGFRNIDTVAAETPLADDKTGIVRAPGDCILLMPLYQGLGDEGFFLGRPVRRAWLRISALVRSARLHGLLRLLPGVRRHPSRPNALAVSAAAGKRYPSGLFSLFGYRRVRREGQDLLFVRRHQFGARGTSV